MTDDLAPVFHPRRWFRPEHGPRYRQFAEHLGRCIAAGELPEGQRLPPERDLAGHADVSRVTVRKAMERLVQGGLVEQRHGAGNFVLGAGPRVQQSLSSLVSFTETLAARGLTASSEMLSVGLFPPKPDEMMALGLAPQDHVARLRRLRSGSGTPVALETSSLPADILPRPEQVETSLYVVLRQNGHGPTRAIQRVTAVNATGSEATLLGLPDGAAVLRIDRTAYLETGRPIEFTSGLYRADIYDFVSEVRHEVAAIKGG